MRRGCRTHSKQIKGKPTTLGKFPKFDPYSSKGGMLLQLALTKELVEFQLVHKMLVTTSSSPLLTLLNSFSVIRYRIQSQVPAAAADTTL